MQASLILEKERMKFKDDEKKILVPLRGKDESRQQEFIEDTVTTKEIHRTIMEEDQELIEEGEIPMPSVASRF